MRIPYYKVTVTNDFTVNPLMVGSTPTDCVREITYGLTAAYLGRLFGWDKVKIGELRGYMEFEDEAAAWETFLIEINATEDLANLNPITRKAVDTLFPHRENSVGAVLAMLEAKAKDSKYEPLSTEFFVSEHIKLPASNITLLPPEQEAAPKVGRPAKTPEAF